MQKIIIFKFSDPSGEEAQGYLFSQALPASFPAGNPTFPNTTIYVAEDTPAVDSSAPIHATDDLGNDIMIYNTGRGIYYARYYDKGWSMEK